MTELYLHPAVQFVASGLAIYVLFTGMQRFRRLHLHHKAAFNWKRHVLLGWVALLLWSIGLIGGFVVTRDVWYTNFITGLHAKVGVAMGPLLAIGFGTGLYMHRVKRKRTLLPLIHGANNTLLCLLAAYQVYSGWPVMQKFVLDSSL